MNTIIFILILLLAVAAFVLSILNRQRLPIKRSLPSEPRQFDGLFAEQNAEEAKLLVHAEAKLHAEEERDRLIKRAIKGDVAALDEAHTRADADLYHKVLKALIAQTSGDVESLQTIAEYIVESGYLRSSAEFAQMLIEHWSRSFDQRLLPSMLYISALSDDAATFQSAVDSALKEWRASRLPQVSAKDFLAMVESAYWLIAVEVRSSGSGFLIKRAIADVRRELAAADRWSA